MILLQYLDRRPHHCIKLLSIVHVHFTFDSRRVNIIMFVLRSMIIYPLKTGSCNTKDDIGRTAKAAAHP